ncbi:MAG TPA: putative Ig domain-containing protein [Gammaproteobacteria bacterium]|nr:putative Ig domain-containing protein [Gammaproteobacteria bacterium]HRP85957.1 putative Ig domain-containing protein [Gammaproteobacteria bacterium]
MNSSAPVISRLTIFERLLTLFTAVRPGEGRSIFVMLLQIFLLLFGYYVIRLVRETLILVEGSPEIRAYSTGAIAVTLIFIIPLYKLLFDYLKNRGNKSAVLLWVGGFFISNLLIFALLVWLGIPIAVPFYIWVGVFNVMVIAQFWAFAADLFNVKTGQRLFAVIMMGAALGAMAGSQAGGRLFSMVGVTNLMLMSAALLAAVLLLSRHAERIVPEGSRSVPAGPSAAPEGNLIGQVLGGFRVVARSGYLARIALFVMLLNLVNTNGGYVLVTFLSGHARDVVAAGNGVLSTGDVIARFWGNYWTWFTALQIVIQLFFVARIFRWFGVRGAILVLPAVMVLNYGLILFVPVFAVVRVMMIIENATNMSMGNTTNHTLYLPVTREEKYVGKTTIDTFMARFGDLLSAGLVMLTAQFLGLEVGWMVAINLALALALFALGNAIGKYHRSQVRHNLENLPPVVSRRLPDVYVPAGQVLMFSVPDRAFIDPDPGDALRYQARAADGGPLPGWIRFDAHNQSFTIRPPAGRSGTLEVTLSATDFEGLSVDSGFGVSYGSDPIPRFIDAPATTGPGSPAR